MEDATPLAGFAADSTQGYDVLGIESEVQALASLIASRDVMPPLSIGLFGTEGSGKSFFRHRLHERVSKLTQIAKQTRLSGVLPRADTG